MLKAISSKTVHPQENPNHLLWKENSIMPLMQEKIYTIDDIYDLPDGQRAELIDGQMFMMAPPTRKHQEIIGELFAVIREYILRHGGSCRVYIAPFAVFLNENNKNYVEPDISVICDPDKLTDEGCTGAPDWIIEIVSPSSRKMDYNRKLFKYRTAGVREYWIVDPDKNRITVYYFEKDDMNEYSFSDNIPSGLYPDFSINLSELNIQLPSRGD